MQRSGSNDLLSEKPKTVSSSDRKTTLPPPRPPANRPPPPPAPMPLAGLTSTSPRPLVLPPISGGPGASGAPTAPPPPPAVTPSFRRHLRPEPILVRPSIARVASLVPEGIASYVLFQLTDDSADWGKLGKLRLKLVAVGVYSLHRFVPLRFIPTSPRSSSGRKRLPRSAPADGLSAASGTRIWEVSLDTWGDIAMFLDGEDIAAATCASRTFRCCLLNDVVIRRVLHRDNPRLVFHLELNGFLRFADYFCHVYRHGIDAVQVNYSARARAVEGEGPLSTVPLPPPEFWLSLPPSSCRYVFCDIPGLGFKVDPHAPPPSEGGPEPLEQADKMLLNRGCSVLWTPPSTPMWERTVYAMCHQELKSALPTLRGLEVRDHTEFALDYVRNRIPKRFRPFLKPRD